MGALYDIFTEYSQMRNNGLDTKAALAALRPYIEPLTKAEKEELAQNLRAWEAGGVDATQVMPPPLTEQTSAKKADVIRPLGQSSSPGVRTVASADIEDPTLWVTCPHCNKKNRKNEVFCFACGQLLEPPSGQFDTRHFKEADASQHNPDYFGMDSVLLIEARNAKMYFEVRPQQRTHELIIGRSTGNSAMAPDIDLAEYQASESGVSRLHLALHYDPQDSALTVHDLGSANGSFINGQKLHAKEKRVLRHGDELRLGRLVLRVYFRHPGEEVRP